MKRSSKVPHPKVCRLRTSKFHVEERKDDVLPEYREMRGAVYGYFKDRGADQAVWNGADNGDGFRPCRPAG